MSPRVDLIWLGTAAEAPAWTLGQVARIERSPAAVHAMSRGLAVGVAADAWLFWDSLLAPPEPARVVAQIDRPGDVWHCGLALGIGGKPEILDFIAPTWTLNCDPSSKVEATSWRVSLRACLVRTPVLRWSPPRRDFDTLDGAALEWGHRCVMFGVLPRTAPSLMVDRVGSSDSAISLADEIRFALARFGRRWAGWAVARAAITGYARPEDLADAWLQARAFPTAADPQPYVAARTEQRARRPSVSVLIPTLDRYRYLRTVLAQLRQQTVPPTEIIVVDQTPARQRDRALMADFADLPLHLITLDAPGQCTARNAGLVQARGDAILFVDDDDELEPDLLARHLEQLERSRMDVCSGVAHEPSSGPLPAAFTRRRVSDVFPTHNTLARRQALERSGLFDLAYDHGTRADGDLGVRIYLSGAVMILEPSISVLHHRAPRGGLRAHGARVVTYGSSRLHVTQRHLSDVSEIYRALRYFTARQVHEALVQSAVGTMSASGTALRRLLKVAYGSLLMPLTIIQLYHRLAAARQMLVRFPQIPALPPRPR